MANLCAKCNDFAEFSNSIDHPDPYKNQWLCRNCYVEVMKGLIAPRSTHSSEVA
jgi:hypothetical protein